MPVTRPASVDGTVPCYRYIRHLRKEIQNEYEKEGDTKIAREWAMPLAVLCLAEVVTDLALILFTVPAKEEADALAALEALNGTDGLADGESTPAP